MRPGAGSLAWLRAVVRGLQRGDPLAPVTVVVRSPYLRLVTRRALAQGGCANVTVLLLRQVAERVGGRSPPDDDRTPLTGVLEAAAIRAALADDPDGAFGRVAQHQALHDALAGLFRELRRLGDPERTLETISANGSVGRATVETYRRFLHLTRPFVDGPGLARRAAALAGQARARSVRRLGALVIYLPATLDAGSLALLGQVGKQVPVRAAFVLTGEHLADGLQEHDAALLAQALGTPSPTGNTSAALPAEVRLVSAPEPADEVRHVVRGIAADVERGVPLWRIATLYSQEEVYGGPIRDALDAAEIPWHAALGRPLTASGVARSLLGLLALRERRFAREAVLDWLSSRPPLDATAEDPLGSIAISAWDRISRRAQVVEGAAQWVQRCTTQAALLEREEQRVAELRSPDIAADALTPDSDHAHAIAAAITRLRRDTTPPRDGSTWEAFITWAEGLNAAYLPMGPSWPAAEQDASAAVATTLASLAEAALLESTTTFRTFRSALTAALEARRLPEGRPGVGVVVSPLAAILGAQFDRVYILGAVEGVFPGRPPADPLASSQSGPDPLGRRERQREVERRA